MKKIVINYTLLIVSFVMLLALAYSIPNSFIQSKANHSISAITEEGDYRLLNPEDYGSRLDNSTDRLMINTALKGSANPLYEAMDNSNYARYWHGTQIILRPLLMFISYTAIRQIYGFLLVLLIGLTFYFILKKLDVFVALSFLVSLMFVRFYTFFLSMQFSNIFVILFLALIYLMSREDQYFKKRYYIDFFIIVGAISNFVDLLTTPLITLGVPLILIYYWKSKNEEPFLLDTVKQTLGNSILWGLGYGVTWGLKWIIASLVLKRNIVLDAITQILFRTEGDKNWPVSRIRMLELNFNLMFNKLNILFLAMVLLAFIGFIVINRRNIKFKFNYFTAGILVTGLFPYAWYIILANHSQIHFWFTYRLQYVSIFAVLAILSFYISEATKK
ncbi:hypothetical protein [Marinilactibacillus psychrotolerans]|uniref:hypothetical protein n=1 Tax=Marinilactibacillus psychrotolerans TaxID=191770 RepID=UPI00388602C5